MNGIEIVAVRGNQRYVLIEKKNKLMKAALYLRVSTNKQDLENQRLDC